MGAHERASASSTSSLRALRYRFAVHTDDEQLGRELEDLFAALREPGPVDHWYSVSTAAAEPPSEAGSSGTAETGRFDLSRDGVPLIRRQSKSDAIDWLVWDVNRGASEASRDHLLFHAGGVQSGETGVVLPAPSGSGKSTLSAALAVSGLRYLSDELVALDLSDGTLLPYPKPVSMKPGPGLAALHELSGARGSARWDPAATRELQLPIGDGGLGRTGEPCVPGFVIVPRYVRGSRTTLEPLTETQAFFELATNSVNFAQHGEVATAVLGALVARCACAVLTMSDIDEACRLVLEFTGARAVERAR